MASVLGHAGQLLEVAPGSVSGTCRASPSKSATHRAVLIASLADGLVAISNPLMSADTRASIVAAEAFGAVVERRRDQLLILAARDDQKDVTIDCGNSGTTLRLATGLAAARSGRTTLDGDESLRRRPMAPLIAALRAAGVEVETKNDRAPLTVRGPLISRELTIDGSHSSQFVSALLLALTAAGGDGSIEVTRTLVSTPYLEMTLRALERAGVAVQSRQDDRGRRLEVAPGARPRGGDIAIPGDWSSAAFLLCAGALKGSVSVTDLPPPAEQADGAIVDLLDRMGATITGPSGDRPSGHDWQARRAPLRGIDVDLGDCPDLFPILAVTLAHAHGPSRLYGAAHLRGKETDRIERVVRNLRRLGVAVVEAADGIDLAGDARLERGVVSSGGDHRILMAFTIGALAAAAPLRFPDAQPEQVVAVSYPRFFEDLHGLGACFERIGDS